MRRVRSVLVILAIAACGKGGGSAPAASSGSAVATAGPRPDDPFKSVALPELAPPLRADNMQDGLLVVATDKAIVVDGNAMLVVSDGAVDPAEIEGGARGMRIARLKAWADSWRKLPNAADATVLLAVAPTLPSRVPLQVIMSFLPAGQADFAFVVRTPDGAGTVPVHLPRVEDAVARGPGAPTQNPDDQPIQMVLSVTPKRAVLWSISGLEGTLSQPKLDLTPAAGGAWLTTVRDNLTDIAKRRWEGKTRPDDQKSIVVMVDSSLASSALVAAIAAVRTDAKGQPLFPDVMLSVGFDDDVASTKPPEPDRKDADDVAMQDEEVARFADMLTGEGASGDSIGDMSARTPGADLNAQIEAVREGGGQIVVGGGTGRGTRGDGDPRDPGSGTGNVRGPDIVDDKTPGGRISVAGKVGMDESSLDVDMVLRKVMSAYMAGLKRCYKNGLKRDPTMRGKVTLGFTVNEAGRSVAGSAKGFDADVDRCMEALIAHWTFPRPKDADGEPTDASFRITLTMTPD